MATNPTDRLRNAFRELNAALAAYVYPGGVLMFAVGDEELYIDTNEHVEVSDGHGLLLGTIGVNQ